MNNHLRKYRRKQWLRRGSCICRNSRAEVEAFCRDQELPSKPFVHPNTNQKIVKDDTFNDGTQLCKPTQRCGHLFCDPCHFGDVRAKATSFCQTCKDPKPFCRECARLHICQESNEDHEICDDITQFCNPNRTSDDE